MAKRRENRIKELAKFNTWYHEDIEAYKKFCESRAKNHKYNQAYVTELTDKIRAYFRKKREADKVVTVSGLFYELGILKKDYYRMKNGDYDWRLPQFLDYNNISEEDIKTEFDEDLGYLDYWIDADGQYFIMNTYSEIIEKTLISLEAVIEETMLNGKTIGAVKGCIFLLKSRFGWRDCGDLNYPKNLNAKIETYTINYYDISDRLKN